MFLKFRAHFVQNIVLIYKVGNRLKQKIKIHASKLQAPIEIRFSLTPQKYTKKYTQEYTEAQANKFILRKYRHVVILVLTAKVFAVNARAAATIAFIFSSARTINASKSCSPMIYEAGCEV